MADINAGLEDTTITGSVATNDSDVDVGDALAYALTNVVAGLVLNADGSYSLDASDAAYQHLAEGATTDVVANYTVTDEHGATATLDADHPSSPASMTRSMRSMTRLRSHEDATTANPVASLLANDTDPDSGDIIRITSVTQGAKGSVAFNNGGTPGNPADDTLTYTANGNVLDTLGVGETATDTFTYTVSDGHGSTDTATVTVTINGVNDAPVIDLNGALPGPGATLNYSTGAAATAIAPSGTVTDVDYSNSGDFNGGTLTVAFTANGSATDQLTIQNQGVGAGQIGVSGSNVTFGGTTIGTFSGGTNGSNLVVTFNASSHACRRTGACLNIFSTQTPPPDGHQDVDLHAGRR